ncbi:MAG TPA: hypothetical protein DCS83_08655 [Prevotella sp.]|nr:hypothetical protein [Prevotella sp.]
MNKKNIFVPLLATIGLLPFSACSDNNTETGNPYLNFDGITQTINVGVEGIKKDNRIGVTVRSNRDWKVNLNNQADSSWLHYFIDEGEGDGIMYYWVDANSDFKAREGKINFINDGNMLNALDILQAANKPKIEIVNAANGYTMLPIAGLLAIPVNHNIPWAASLGTENWARIDSCGVDTVYLAFDRNPTDARTVTLTVRGEGDYNSLISSTVITQEAPGLVMNENFNWMNEGENKPYYQYPEIAYSKWSDAEKGVGWTTLDGWLYGGIGYIKLGKTNYAGDVESPALSTLKAATDVQVSFQAIGYIASNGNKDDGIIKVGIIGPGTIVADEMSTINISGTSYTCAKFECSVFPNSANNENGTDYNPWAQDGSNFNFEIKGATKDTRIVFVGGDKWNSDLRGIGQGKNRVLIDNVKVVEQ